MSCFPTFDAILNIGTTHNEKIGQYCDGTELITLQANWLMVTQSFAWVLTAAARSRKQVESSCSRGRSSVFNIVKSFMAASNRLDLLVFLILLSALHSVKLIGEKKMGDLCLLESDTSLPKISRWMRVSFWFPFYDNFALSDFSSKFFRGNFLIVSVLELLSLRRCWVKSFMRAVPEEKIEVKHLHIELSADILGTRLYREFLQLFVKRIKKFIFDYTDDCRCHLVWFSYFSGP